MKLAYIFIATMLALCTTHAQSGIDTLFVHQTADTTYILNNNIFSNCGTSFMTTVSISSDSIIVLETDTSHRPLRCMCHFDVSVAITGLSPGMYRIFIFRINMFQDSVYVVDSTIYTIAQQNSSSFSSRSQMSACHELNVTSVGTLKGPKSFSLLGNYPNPFNPVTIIRYQIQRRSKVKLEIFDELGRFLVTLVDEE